jgi:hypothetical protein
VAAARDQRNFRYLDIAIHATERMAKLLGLDAPTRTQNAHTVPTERPLEAAGEEDLRRELAEINRQIGLTTSRDEKNASSRRIR